MDWCFSFSAFKKLPNWPGDIGMMSTRKRARAFTQQDGRGVIHNVTFSDKWRSFFGAM